MSVSREIVKRLAVHLREKMPELQAVLEDWPDPNLALDYPSISIFTQPATHRPYPPYLLSSEDSEDGNSVISKHVVGDYEWKLQLDMWCSSKPQRNALYEAFYRAFNSQFVDGINEMVGISLSLVDYHNVLARYDLLEYNYDTDNEAATQRKEWRAKMTVISHCKAILVRQDPKIKTLEIHSDIRTNVKVDVDSDFSPDILPVT